MMEGGGMNHGVLIGGRQLDVATSKDESGEGGRIGDEDVELIVAEFGIAP